MLPMILICLAILAIATPPGRSPQTWFAIIVTLAALLMVATGWHP
jgi:hypothetical protein